jgi:hypothetical protein
MASEILGLFTTPEQYQLAQRQAQEAQAIQFAQLDPMARANYGTFRAGQQLGSALGGALGGEDPQLKLISMRQQLASQLDPSKPESFMQAAELAARSGDQQFAIGLADAGRQAAVQIAQANKERQLAVPVDIQKAQMIPQIQDAIDQYSALPVSPERDRALKLLQNQLKVLVGDTSTKLAAPIQVANRIVEINRTLRTLKPEDPTYQDLIAEKDQLQKSEKMPDAIQIAKRVSELEAQLSPDAGVALPPQVRAGLEAELNNLKKQAPQPSVGSEREGIALELYGKNFYDLDPTQRAAVNRKAEQEATKKAAVTAPKVEVNLKDPTATAKASLDVMTKWEGFLKSGGDVEVANRFKAVQSAVAMANAGNPTADGALLYNIAKMYDPSGAVQEGDKKSITGNPAIPERFKLLVQGVLNGGSFTPQQRKDLEKIAIEIVKNRQSQLNVYRKQYVNKAKDLGGTEADILNPYQGLDRPPLSEFPVNPRGRQ